MSFCRISGCALMLVTWGCSSSSTGGTGGPAVAHDSGSPGSGGRPSSRDASTSAPDGTSPAGGGRAGEGGHDAAAPTADSATRRRDAEAPDASADAARPPALLDAGDAGACHPVEEGHAIEGANHVTTCSVVTYRTNPPSSGDHYGTWAAYRTYDAAIPEGFWVHSLEHGAIVFTYNCPAGCAAELTQLKAMIAALPEDTVCVQTAGIQRRVILTPDPKLDVRFGASAWGFTLRSDCLDAAAFAAFAAAHYAQAPEDICSDGADVSTGLPVGCGETP